MNRRDLLQRTLVSAIAAAGGTASSSAREFRANFDASKELARSDWKPVFLDEHQNATLIALSDIIIPATDTPGAKAALANRFIDSILAVEQHDAQRDFLNGLAFLEGESLARYRKAFVHASPDEQVELVSYLAYPQSLETWGGSNEGEAEGVAHRHFRTLKDWISRAYYSSEIGQRELGYDGGPPHGIYAGCAGEITSREPAARNHSTHGPH